MTKEQQIHHQFHWSNDVLEYNNRPSSVVNKLRTFKVTFEFIYKNQENDRDQDRGPAWKVTEADEASSGYKELKTLPHALSLEPSNTTTSNLPFENYTGYLLNHGLHSNFCSSL